MLPCALPAAPSFSPLRSLGLALRRLFCSAEVVVGVFHFILGKKSEAAFTFPVNFKKKRWFAWTLFQ